MSRSETGCGVLVTAREIHQTQPRYQVKQPGVCQATLIPPLLLTILLTFIHYFLSWLVVPPLPLCPHTTRTTAQIPSPTDPAPSTFRNPKSGLSTPPSPLPKSSVVKVIHMKTKR